MVHNCGAMGRSGVDRTAGGLALSCVVDCGGASFGR